VENPKVTDNSENLGVDVRIIRINLREMGCEDVDSVHLAQDRDQWRAVVNTVMNLRGSKKGGEFLD
jgi:uncharacterized protein YPO0396